ncbi:MAG: hypothetical protein RL499_903 [Actinomycetota bacterium]
MTPVRISRFFAGGLVSAAVVATLSGCVGAPPLTIYGGLSERCFPTRTVDAGYFALIGITVTNDTGRSVILRDARVIELDNATITDMSVVPVPSAYSTFGVAPGGELSTEQVDLWRDRAPVGGTVIEPRSTVEIVVELHAEDYTDYAGLRGLRLRYDDGWFSATSSADATVGFVPPWSRCGSHLG